MAARRDVRPYIYAGLDLLLAAGYAIALSTTAVNRLWWAALLLWSLVAFLAVMAASMIYRRPWTWLAGVIAGGALLVTAVVLLVLILMSAGFLAGVYGAFGQAASTLSLVAAALLVEVVALVPLLQTKFAMTRAGRRAFGLPPVWR